MVVYTADPTAGESVPALGKNWGLPIRQELAMFVRWLRGGAGDRQ
jgi:hypothetical protein